jgi:hypothetical protein
MNVTQKNFREVAAAAVLALRRRGIPEGEVLHEAMKFYEVALAAATPAPPETTTIHLLQGGAAICGTMRGMPGSWPEGHKWISYKEHDARKTATCAPCKAALPVKAVSK